MTEILTAAVSWDTFDAQIWKHGLLFLVG